MPDAATADPIAQLLAGHSLTRQHLAGLSDPSLQAQAIAWLDGPAVAQRRILRLTLFPALIESMAGSDAVCLKGMTRGLADRGEELQHRWRAIRACLSDAGSSAEALQPWIDDYLGYLQRADEELLPMAARLLDETALDQLRHALG
ncbi:hypothetical protein [Castellaniella sp.]|uniref:hypothetical protein n=1 Tax=Castellaniella sp. TaxID=1955812 RepID=UPI003C741412